MAEFSKRNLSTPSLPHRARAAFYRTLRDPRLAPELTLKFIRRKLFGGRHARRTGEYANFLVDPFSAVEKLTGASASEMEALLNEQPVIELREELESRRIELGLRGRTYGGNVDLVYLICRISQPQVVLETGVAFGWTTSYILQALEANGSGKLISVDLPPMRSHGESIIGSVVPERLKHRWTLHRGPQSRIVPQVLEAEPGIGFIHYDSDKTYHGMKWAYDTLWPALDPGAILMSDDVWNDAFLEFSESVSKQPLVVETNSGRARVALIGKARDSG